MEVTPRVLDLYWTVDPLKRSDFKELFSRNSRDSPVVKLTWNVFLV